MCSLLHRLEINVAEAEFVPDSPPWLACIPTVSYTSTSKAELPVLQKQQALAAIHAESSTIPASHRVFTDGSVQRDGKSGSAVFSPDMDPPEGGWVGRRLPNCSSSTFCELQGVLDAVTLLCQRGLNGVVICDSQSALQSILSPRPSFLLAKQILALLSSARDRSLVITFLWIPSHVGLSHSDTVDELAKAACALAPRDNAPPPSPHCHRSRIRLAALQSTDRSRDSQRPHSTSIQHYDTLRTHRYRYRRHGIKVRRHNVVSARIRLGYRPVWQVARLEEEEHFTTCTLCNAPFCNTLDHYCLHCPVVHNMLPQRQSLVDICRFLLNHENLDIILARHPQFGGC